MVSTGVFRKTGSLRFYVEMRSWHPSFLDGWGDEPSVAAGREASFRKASFRRVACCDTYKHEEPDRSTTYKTGRKMNKLAIVMAVAALCIHSAAAVRTQPRVETDHKALILGGNSHGQLQASWKWEVVSRPPARSLAPFRFADFSLAPPSLSVRPSTSSRVSFRDFSSTKSTQT